MRRRGLAGGTAIRHRLRDITLVDEVYYFHEDMTERVIRPPFEVTPIFMPGFVAGTCPLFIVTGEAEGRVNLMTAFPLQNDETFYWGVPGFAPGNEELVGQYMTTLLATINARNLKPIGPSR